MVFISEELERHPSHREGGWPASLQTDGDGMVALEMMLALQGSAKRWGLRCVNSLPGSAWL